MGGTAFVAQGYESKRMNKDQFNKIKEEIYNFLDLLNIDYYDIPYIREKETFGDLDVVVISENSNTLDKIIANRHKLDSYVYFNRNKDLMSMLYKGHQIDFISTKKEYSDSHAHYLSHNDLGNLLGRTIKQAGYKHGHNGLFYVYREGDSFKKEIPITTDINVTLGVLGLNSTLFHNGFDNFEDMFEYVTTSPYFNPVRYELSNLNNRNRVRDKKRANYAGFLKYIKENKFTTSIQMKSPFEVFPFLVQAVEEIKSARKKESEIKSKFNGDLCMKYTDLTGKELGIFINRIKLKYPDIHLSSDDEIKNIIISENK